MGHPAVILLHPGSPLDLVLTPGLENEVVFTCIAAEKFLDDADALSFQLPVGYCVLNGI